MRVLLVLLIASTLCVEGDAYAQRTSKSRKKQAEPKPIVVKEDLPKVPTVTKWIMVGADGKELTPQQAAYLSRQRTTIVQAEPLIGIHYLLSYPKEAIAGQVQGTVTYTVTVRDGKVIDAKIERPDNMYLTTAVLEAANKLQFDRSWHQPDKPEFTYTRSVEFTLPDQIHSHAPPVIFETP